MALSIPFSRYKSFQRKPNAGRFGQQFYEHMELHKVTNPEDKEWCDKLYNIADKYGRQMVLAAIDHAN